MTSDLENQRLQAEIEKLRAESESFRKPFSKPSNWLPLFVAFAAILTAVGQWHISDIKSEKAALEAERRLFESEKELDVRKSQLAKVSEKLKVSRQKQDKAKLETNLLRQKAAKQRGLLTELEKKIEAKSALFAKLSQEISSDVESKRAKALIQQSEQIDREISDDLKKLAIVYKGKEYRIGDRVRIVFRAGTFKPVETGHKNEIGARAGHTGTILNAETFVFSKRLQQLLNVKLSPQSLQLANVKWDPQEWTDDKTKELVTLPEFNASIHPDYLEVIRK